MEKPAVNIGAVLRDQREKLGYSLKEVSQYTRIRKTFLESLEDNKFTDLPGQAYVVGFIKVYALYLGLDSNSLLAELEEPEKRDVPPSLESIPITKSQSRRSSKHSREGWRVFVFGLLVVLILGGAIYLLLPMFQAKDLATVTSNEVMIESGTTEPGTTEPVATEQKPAPAQVEAAESATKTEQTVVTTSPKEEPVPVAVVVETSPLAVEEKTSQSKQLPPVPSQGSSLRMLALTESSLIIYVDDRKPQRYTLHDGLDLTWNIKASVKVELAGSDVARFWLGGLELDLDELKSFQLQPAD
jgi:cytoskeletal protein RodZ